jgi:hypothetical protein
LSPPRGNSGRGTSNTIAVVVQCLRCDCACFGKHLRTRKTPLCGIEFAFALVDDCLSSGGIALASSNLCLGAGNRCNCLSGLGARLVALRVEYVNLHLRQRLTLFHKIALVDDDVLHPPSELSCDVNLSGLNAAVSIDETCAQA